MAKWRKAHAVEQANFLDELPVASQCDHCAHYGFCKAAVEGGRPLHHKCEKYPGAGEERFRHMAEVNMMEMMDYA